MTKRKTMIKRITAIALAVVTVITASAISAGAANTDNNRSLQISPINFSFNKTIKLGVGEYYDLWFNYQKTGTDKIGAVPIWSEEESYHVDNHFLSVKYISDYKAINKCKVTVQPDKKLPKNGYKVDVAIGLEIPVLSKMTDYDGSVKWVSSKTYGCAKNVPIQIYNAPTSIKINEGNNFILNKNKQYTISESTNKGSYANADNLSWITNNSSVVKAEKVSGTNKCRLITTGKTGTATITVKTYNGKTAKCKVTVK